MDHSRDYDLTGYKIDKRATASELEKIRQHLEEKWQQPKRDVVVQHLTWLYTVTSHREHHATDLTMILSAYTDELLRYPADTIKPAIRAVQRKSKWFPSLHEITEELDYLTMHRSKLLEAVSTAVCYRKLHTYEKYFFYRHELL